MKFTTAISALSGPARSSLQAAILALLSFVLVAASLVSASTAEAATSYLCNGYAACANLGYGSSGYAGASGTSYWGMYAGHNCTNYAAYRLIKNGINAGYLRGQGNAFQWGSVAKSHGVAVDSNPRVGDIAWWAANSNGAGKDGHVAYVEQVGNGYIVTSEDVWGGDFHWAKRTPSTFPTGFIHFGSGPVPATPVGGAQVAFQANTAGLWSVGSGGTGDQRLGMAQGTNPAVATLSNGGHERAFLANTGNLWINGDGGTGDLLLGMAVKGREVRASAESGEDWLTTVDSLDLLEILAAFDHRLGRLTDPQRLPDSFTDLESVVTRLNQIHGLA